MRGVCAVTIPPPAYEIMALIKVTETGRADATAYDVIFGHNEGKLSKPITAMTVDELMNNQKGFTTSFGSSASGAFQFMRATLGDLKKKLELTGAEIFNPELQDRLGFELLKRRGFQPWLSGKTTTDAFMVGLAREWASFPVPSDMKGAHRRVSRGETYYAGDALNRALIAPDVVWLACEAARKVTAIPPPIVIPPKPEIPPAPGDDIVLSPEEWRYALTTIARVLTNPAALETFVNALQAEAQKDV
jgi:muramidase (phage lysozyme)